VAFEGASDNFALVFRFHCLNQVSLFDQQHLIFFLHIESGKVNLSYIGIPKR
jgi:hypothetical protein